MYFVGFLPLPGQNHCNILLSYHCWGNKLSIYYVVLLPLLGTLNVLYGYMGFLQLFGQTRCYIFMFIYIYMSIYIYGFLTIGRFIN